MKDPKKDLKLFKQIVLETSKLYGITPEQVSSEQYDYVSAKRKGVSALRYIGRFATLRNYCFPSSRTKKVDAGVAAIRRLLNVKA